MRSLTLILIIIAVSSCSNNSKKIQVGLLLHKLEGTAWEIDANYFKQEAEKLNIELLIRNAKGNEVLQYEQADEMIKKEVNAIILTAVNTYNADGIIRKIKRNNIKVITYRRMVKNSHANYFVGFNSKKAGQIQAEYILNKFPDTANIVILEGDRSDLNAQIISDQHAKILSEKVSSGDYNIVYKTFIENWSDKEAYYYFAKAYQLSSMDIDAVLSANDDLSTGVAMYLKDIGYTNKIVLTGMDMHLAACKRINCGKQDMTLYKPIKELIKKTLQLTIHDTNIQQKADTTIELLIDPLLITKENVNKVITQNNLFQNSLK
ncbi:MAG: substrate-binding domain-containing protein [Bacteroidales bacterium]|nr:substrate-binding domain-containing protein [Bacteroidales bacterium]